MNGIAAWAAARRRDPALRLMKRRALWHLTAGLPRGALVCDLGCGTGEDAAALARRGFRVVAIDADPRMIARARQHFPDRVKLRRASFGTPPHDIRGRCDAVLAFHAADHPPGPAAFAAAAVSLLQPGGRLVCTATMRGSWQARIMRGRPLRSSLAVTFAGRRTQITLSGLDDLLSWFTPSFRLERIEPLGLCLPGAASFPGAGRRLPGFLLRLLDALESRLPFRPFVRLADHALVIVKKR